MMEDECFVALELSAVGKDVPPEFRHFTVEVYDQDVMKAASAAFATVAGELLANGYGLDRHEDAVTVHTAEPHRMRFRPIGEAPAPLSIAQWRCEAYASAPEEVKVAGWAKSPFSALSVAYSALVRHRGRWRDGLDGVAYDITALVVELEWLRGCVDGERARILGYAIEDLNNACDNLMDATREA